MHLSDKQREEAFPVHIELGVPDEGRMSYPVVDLGGSPGTDQLPDEGCALVHFKKSEDGLFEMQRICLAADGGEEEDESEPYDLENALTKFRRPKKEKANDDGGA